MTKIFTCDKCKTKKQFDQPYVEGESQPHIHINESVHFMNPKACSLFCSECFGIDKKNL